MAERKLKKGDHGPEIGASIRKGMVFEWKNGELYEVVNVRTVGVGDPGYPLPLKQFTMRNISRELRAASELWDMISEEYILGEYAYVM